jgi:hypothetical protein
VIEKGLSCGSGPFVVVGVTGVFVARDLARVLLPVGVDWTFV